MNDCVTNKEAREEHRAGVKTLGCPERLARINGDANGVRMMAALRPAAKHVHIRAGLAATRPGGNILSVMGRVARPKAIPAKKSGKMTPPCG